MVQELSFNNKNMKYFKFGSGNKIMVMIPGLSIKSVMEYESSIINDYKVFEKEFSIYCFDRISNPNENYSIKDMAKDTLEVLHLLNLKDIYLFGASQGAMICFNMLLLEESLFKKFVVASSCTRVDDFINNSINGFIKYAKNKDKKELFLGFSKLIYPSEFFLKYENVLTDIIPTIKDEELDKFIIFAKSIINFDIFEQVKDVNIPVLFVHDKLDNLININNVYNFLDYYKYKNNFTNYFFEGFGHALYDLAPDFKKVMKDFFLGSD